MDSNKHSTDANAHGADAGARGPDADAGATHRTDADAAADAADAAPADAAGDVWRLQEAPIVDRVLEDGTALTRLPYPLLVDAKGMIQDQDFWRGNLLWVVGFARDLDVWRIDLRVRDFIKKPEAAVGMYLVTGNDKGMWYSHLSAVQEARYWGFKTTPVEEGTM